MQFKTMNFSPEAESSEYYPHTFTLQNKNGLYKIAKTLLQKQDGL